jgi:hypothetical protein
MPALGETFRLADPGVDPHLHIIISDPAANPNSIVTANFTSWRVDKDQSCVVEVGEHPQVTRRSCVDYRRERCITLAQFNSAVSSGRVTPQTPVSEALLRRIVAGAALSPFIPLGNRQLLVDQGLIDQ